MGISSFGLRAWEDAKGLIRHLVSFPLLRIPDVPKGSDSSGPFPLPSALMGAQRGPTKPLPATSREKRGQRKKLGSRVKGITDTRGGKLRGQDEEEKKENPKTHRGNDHE